MGFYLHRGRLSFFRRCMRGLTEPQHHSSSTAASDDETEPWETTGAISDLSWAEGRRLTPCLAFRDECAYRVRVVCVGSQPPIPVERWNVEDETGACNESGWSGFDWEVFPP